MTTFSPVEKAIEHIHEGRIVIVVDAEDRENEGDVTAAAEKVTPEMVYFMTTFTGGQLCVPVAPEIATRLRFSPMFIDDSRCELPKFAVPVDHRCCTTGSSPEERAFTIRSLAAPTTAPEELRQPGHVFPLVAKEHGLLRRSGHTEAAVDLARLAGLTPAGVICEVCSRDRSHMAGRAELLKIARELKFPIVTIEDLTRFRWQTLGSRCSFSGHTPAVTVNPHPNGS